MIRVKHWTVVKDEKAISVWGYASQAVSSAARNAPAIVVDPYGRIVYRSV